MVDFTKIQQKIYKGYGKAAKRLGTQHGVYRAADGIDPLKGENFLFNKLISMDADLTYMKSVKYGDNTWMFLAQDGLLLRNYDYLVGPTITYFIADVRPDDRLSTPLCVECNAVITITRATNAPLNPGTNPYQQYQASESLLLARDAPCSLLEHSRQDSGNMKLPTSVKLPYYEITFPQLDNLTIETGDIIDDDEGRRLSVISCELSKKNLGLRIVAVDLGV